MTLASPAPTPADQQRLALLIEAEAIQLQAFLVILEREEALLIEGDSDSLLTLTQKKNDCYRQLQRLHSDRALLLTALNGAAIRRKIGALERMRK